MQEKQITDLTAHVFGHNCCTELCCQIPKISTKMAAQLLGDNETLFYVIKKAETLYL